MTRFEAWLLAKLLRRIVGRGDHFEDTTSLYQMVREAWRKEFPEDNEPTISDALSECFEATQEWPFGRPSSEGVVREDSFDLVREVVRAYAKRSF